MQLTSDWSFENPAIGLTSSIIINENKIQVEYPCSSSTICTALRILLPSGLYLFELAGGSGFITPSVFVQGERPKDSLLAGGYVSGVLSLKHSTNITLNIGGHGSDSIGGFNGGGNGYGSGFGGGGSTDVRIGKNDPFHRILVAGGGGGSDDPRIPMESNDGNGGSGGGIQSLSFYVLSEYIPGFESNQTSGFSFFQGENGKSTGTSHPLGYKSSCKNAELSGGGGGWFGGFSSHHCNGGSAGGSSFALTKNSTIPIGIIPVYNGNYVSTLESFYAFDPHTSPYLFEKVIHKRGVWNGNGFVIITFLSSLGNIKCSAQNMCQYPKIHVVFFYFCFQSI